MYVVLGNVVQHVDAAMQMQVFLDSRLFCLVRKGIYETQDKTRQKDEKKQVKGGDKQREMNEKMNMEESFAKDSKVNGVWRRGY